MTDPRGHMTPHEHQDDRVPVTLTEATYDETGVHIRGVIPYDQAVRLGITQGEADIGGFSLVNRWAAFTDDELHTITFGLTDGEARGLRDGTRRLQREIRAELERCRGDAAGTTAPNGTHLGAAQVSSLTHTRIESDSQKS